MTSRLNSATAGGRLWRLLALSGSIAAMMLFLPLPSASAHAFLVGSTPADGEVLTAAPSEIRMSFSESVVLDAMVIDIVDSENRHYPTVAVQLADPASAEEDTEQPSEVVASLPPLGRDTYRIDWQTLSSDDLHKTSGTLVFGIGETPTAAGSVEPLPRLEETTLRAMIFLSLAAALGGLLTARLLDRTGADEMTGRAAWRCRRTAVVGAGLGAVSCVGLLVDQIFAGGLSFGDVLFSGYGERFLARELGFGLLLLGAISLCRNMFRPAVRTVLIATGAIFAGVGTALLGHSAANSASAATRVAADAVHLVSAATWSGTLLLAVFVALPLARRGAADQVGVMLRAFALPAVGCFAAMVVSGLYLASGVVGSVDALLLTFYGRTLLFKVVLVFVIGVLALVNTLALRDSARPRIPRRTVIAEAGAAALVLGLAALLTSSQPATEPEFVAAQQSSAVGLRDAAAGDLQEVLAIRPNTPGRNVVLVDVFDTRRPALAPIRSVLISVVGPDGGTGSPVAAENLGAGRWSVTTDLDRSISAVVVTVQRPGLSDVTSDYPWTVLPAAGPIRAVTVSNSPIGGYLTFASAGLLVFTIVIGLGIVLRRRRSTGGDGEVAVVTLEMASSGVE